MTTTQNPNRIAAQRLAMVLRAENDALAAGDAKAAMRFLPEKEAAAAALQASLPCLGWGRAEAAQLQALASENRARLVLAIEVQATILEMVARAARLASPGPVRYGATGASTLQTGALALTLRA